MPTIRHTDNCTTQDGTADYDTEGGRGDRLRRCRTCNRFMVLDQPTKPRHSALVSRYRCAEHLDRSVTWRGTGCPDCAAEALARTSKRPRPTLDEAVW